ncbi:hypothetical protein KAFR_0C02560 [Kazachstania africana CBS 2517]|uniref:RTR1-type domain-containing protein n=1 Tax=Kazachstania africana (strain ATCC 22294 / BCRC 22015 / CBS 2517 / CECT 1963 / NBRC 1671 / NRRL Y-8276) TaxID=1071382 RepID=H2AS99_KAZAF|nr:hypothetical protein KAFR_0C02560 [Kazachstania africana CBS 2517]CCF57249.1 hypothetical protein KAFR_0C02560 [Kazachstania africana CBS 2517]
MTSICDINEYVMKPHQLHERLSIKEWEHINNDIVILLASSFCLDENTLKYVCKFITLDTYRNLIHARNINGRCAYPMCQSHINTASTMSYSTVDNISQYCNDFHFDCSQFLLTQINKTPLYERVDLHMFKTYNTGEQQENHKISDVTLLEELIRNKSTDNDIFDMLKEITAFQLK